MPIGVRAQVFETRARIDTLKWNERISLHTNAVDWALLIPNIGVEYDIRSTNWNRWAVGMSAKTKWRTNSRFKQRLFYNVSEVRFEFRNYWRTRQIDGREVTKHTSFIDRLFSCRRTVVKHPHTTYYRGVYASAGDYSFLVDRKGRQGKFVSGGVTYGAMYPMYVFKSGNSLDLDLGISVGLVATNMEKFRLVDDCYERTQPGKWKVVPFPMPTEARVGLVYRLGKYPINKKYRWRYDVDMRYRERYDSIRYEIEARRQERHITDSITNKIYNDFWLEYDKEAKLNLNNARIAAEKQKAEAAKLKAATTDSIGAMKTDSIGATPIDSTEVQQVDNPTDSISNANNAEAETESVDNTTKQEEQTEQPSEQPAEQPAESIEQQTEQTAEPKENSEEEKEENNEQ
ncbi:DUF3575 domain-containing protein [uncultured Prevotella sp.]|uniref:DUF3575 domain-containing protein n=1 Tax=uncultured Prevotella sp. TaxID=159272 RepID=UPI0026382936|nr:DUF3575 domain-containing protein [uncultured Prevotella sp.]